MNPSEMSGEDFLLYTLSRALPILPPDVLTTVLHLVAAEGFIRSESQENWEQNWAFIAQSVGEFFDPETTPDPEQFEKFREAQELFNKKVEEQEFIEQASSELADVIDLHGVVEPEEYRPGNYL